MDNLYQGFINHVVYHDKYGEGKIINTKPGYVLVKYNDTEIRFIEKTFENYNRFKQEDQNELAKIKANVEFNNLIEEYKNAYKNTIYKDTCLKEIEEIQSSKISIKLKLNRLRIRFNQAKNNYELLKRKIEIMGKMDDIELDSLEKADQDIIIKRIELEKLFIKNCEGNVQLNKYEKEVQEIINNINAFLLCFEDSKKSTYLKKVPAFSKEILNDEQENTLDAFNDLLKSKGLNADDEINSFNELDDMSLRKKDPLIGRENEINTLINVLSRRNKPNAILIGEPGVGKTAIVEELAKLIKNKKVPALKGKKIYELSMGSLIAGTTYRGELEQKVDNIISMVKRRKDIILFVDEIHTMLKYENKNGEIGIGNTLKPYLARGEITMIGATTRDEFEEHIEKDQAFKRRFQVVQVNEMDIDNTLNILQKIKNIYENYYNVIINEKELGLIVKLCDKYLINRQFPDKAIELLDNSCVNAKGVLTESNIYETIKKYYNIDVNEGGEIKKLSNALVKDLYGQAPAIKKILNDLELIKQIKCKDNRPKGVFTFTGPKGTGKTLAATIISENYYSDKQTLKLNMSMYSDALGLNRLIGQYEFKNSYSPLIKQLKNTPNSIIIFDNIEFANILVIEFLKSAINNGYILDRFGNKVSLSDSILICIGNKSNILEYVGADFLSNMDDVVEFNYLSEDAIKQIISREIELIEPELSKDEQTINYVYYLAMSSNFQECGAKEIRRTIRSNFLELADRAKTIIS